MALIELAEMAATSRLQLPEFSRHTRLLVVAPHPDDETIATGLLIQRVLAAGGEVQVLLLTSGDNNPWPQRWLERRLLIGADDRRRWGLRRQQEMLLAMHRLGLPATALQCLDWPDMGLADLLLESPQSMRKAMADAIVRFDPTLLVFPALEDRHPDHSAAHVVVRLALASLAEQPACFSFLVHGPACPRSGVEVPGSAERTGNKLAALEEHRSQIALSRRRLHRLASRPEALVDPQVIRSTILPWRPPSGFRPWLQLSVVSGAGVTSWPWNKAPLTQGESGFKLDLAASGGGDPCFVRLATTLPSPWIFDHWGWCELAPAHHGLA